MQGFPEELFERGYLMQTLPFRRPAAKALISATVFSVAHIISGGAFPGVAGRLLVLGESFAFGLAAAALLLLTRQLWVAVGIHGGFHLARFIAERLGMGASMTQQMIVLTLYLVVAAVVLV